MTDILIKNGTIVTADKTFQGDIAVTGSKISAVSPKSQVNDPKNTIDATGKYVFPGGIDVHTHFDMPFGGTVTADDFFTGTVAAACGGTTTIIDFAIQSKSGSLKQALDEWHKKADGNAVIDYSFHLAVTSVNDSVLKELDEIVKAGVTSVKLFMAYKGTLMVDEDELLKVLNRAKELGILVMVHAEDGNAIANLTSKLLSEGKTAPFAHALSRPAELEESATARVITLAATAGTPLYIVHLSAKGALGHIRLAQANNQSVYAETCPQYLFLTDGKYNQDGSAEKRWAGAKYVMSPPLRSKENIRALWGGLQDGSISVISSDHCSFNFKGQKELGKSDFTKIPNGISGVETRLALLYSSGVAGKRITINKLVDLFSTTPAKLFGLYPRKGEIREGSDADIVIFDPSKRFSIKAYRLHQNVDYCPYDGYKGQGAVEYVISRGKIIVKPISAAKDNTFVGKKGEGEFLRRVESRE
ncbi:MAG: dihydropyrimidinase [Planctomycetes bacterium]|nr:dihydropyrimidinase [Planctomycetota bacterium]